MTCLRYPNSDPYYPGHVIHLRGDEDPHEFVRAMPRQVESSSSAIAVQRNGIRASRKVRRRASRSSLGVSTERPQPVSLHLTSRGLTATQPHLAEGGIVAETTVPEKNRCGTQSGYSAHQYRAERPCDACAKAKAEYDKRRNEAPERAARTRLRARAQNRAEGRLRHMYPAVWRVIYAEELARVHAEDND